MKKKITVLFFGIFALIVNVFSQPTTTFTANNTTICAGANVTFTNIPQNNPTTWTWYFPGGTPSTYTTSSAPGNPGPITYNNAGTYYVTCVVRNGSGHDSVTVPSMIQVNALPTATIMPPSGGICDVVGDTIYFLATGAAGNTYTWAPAGSLSCSACPNPQAYPTSFTVYTITVQNTAGCQSIYTDTVNDPGTGTLPAKITGKDTVCMGTPDTLIASGGASNPGANTLYVWSNGRTTSEIIVTPNVTTVYSLTLTSGTGFCQGSTTFTVTPAPVPHFTITSPDSICYPGPAKLTVSPGGNVYIYHWYGPFGTADTNVFNVSPAVTTIYTLVINNKGCIIDSLLKIKVNTEPSVHFTGATNLCQGSTTIITATGGDQYQWSTGATTSSINVRPPGDITYTVQVRAGACKKDTTFTIIVDSIPFVNFSGDTSICAGDSTTIYVSGGSTYLWNTGSTTDSIHVIGGYPHPGFYPYYVTVTKGACSKDSAEEIVKVYPKPTPAASPGFTKICQWDSVLLIATGGDYYTWSPANSGLNHYIYYGKVDSNEASPAPQPNGTVYTINVCTWGCCLPTTVKVDVEEGVTGYSVCCSQTIQGGTPVNLSASYDAGPFQLEQWLPATGLNCSKCLTPTATVDMTTTYVATFLDLITGCTVSDSATITVFNCNTFVPNVFTPDQPINNRLYVRSLCITNMDFAVFDRFGNKVFETKDKDDGWDGTYKGKPMEMGTYVWYLTGVLSDGTGVNRSGNVTLLR